MKNTMTYVEALDLAIACPSLSIEARDRLVSLREQTAKRNASKSTKPTKTQTENAGLKETLVTLMECGETHTVSEWQEADLTLAPLSNQKVSSLMRQLVDEGKVVKTVVKRKAYFTLA